MTRVFVCGVGRSGTSLMQVLLATSPYVRSLPETGMLRRGIIGDVFVRGAVRPRAHPQYERVGLTSTDGKVDRRLLINTYLEAGDATSDGSDLSPNVVLDKDPRLIEWLPVVMSLFDDAKVVLLVRDPRAVAASKQRARWAAGRTFFRIQLEAEVQASLALKYLLQQDRQRVFLVPFSELVTYPLGTVNSVLEWLGLPRMDNLDSEERARVASGLVAPDEMQWKGRVFEPIEPERTRVWTQQLTQSDKEVVDGLANAQFEVCRLAREQLAADVAAPRGPAFAVLHGAHRASVSAVTALRRHQHRRARRHLNAKGLEQWLRNE